MDWAHKGTFASETASALAGGYSAVLDMPNADPVTTTPATLAFKRNALNREAVCDWGVYYGAHPDGNLETFAAAMPDCIGLKIYCDPTTGDMFVAGRLREEHFAAWRAHGLIAVHAEDEEVDAVLELVARYGVHTHFCHISTRAELDSLRRAKDQGLPVSLGVCPHHLWLTRDDEYRLGPYALMKPPLKTRRDVEALWEALRQGLVDVVESDHAPHARAEKLRMPPAFGVPGVETLLPLLGSAVDAGRLDPERLIELVSANPRRIWDLPCPPDTWTELEIGESRRLRAGDMHALCGWSPFEGQEVRCRVAAVQLRGVRAYDGAQIRVRPGFGAQVQPADGGRA